VSEACFTLVDMAAAIYLILYMFMFASAILLRRNKPDVHRSYRVPAMTTVAVIGFLALLAAFSLGEPRGPWKRARAR
jgi:amino acid transporter